MHSDHNIGANGDPEICSCGEHSLAEVKKLIAQSPGSRVFSSPLGAIKFHFLRHAPDGGVLFLQTAHHPDGEIFASRFLVHTTDGKLKSLPGAGCEKDGGQWLDK